jgi:dCMP deaminase
VNNTDLEYLRLAYQYAAQWSDDPDTQNGSVLLTSRGYTSYGANRVPYGVTKTDGRRSRPAKYQWIEHAERDAIYAAASSGLCVHKSTLYCPWFACPDCARAIIQSGVSVVVGHEKPFSMTPERWIEPIEVARQMLFEAGVETRIVGGDTGVSIRFDGKLVIM